MLTPSYLLHATEPAEEIAERLHQAILNRIIARIIHRFERGNDYILTAQDKWQIEVLQDAGFLLEDIQKEIVDAVPYMQSEIVEAMEDAGVRALEYDDAIYRAAGLDPVDLTQSPSLIRIMQRDFEATLGEWTNFTRTTADAAQQTFIHVCDTAYHQAMTGTVSVSQAVKEAIADLITEGISVQYANGYTTTIEAATARAVRTGISQASAHIQLARMDEMEVDLVLVSSHLGARPSHHVWQGKVYSRNGGDEYPDFVVSTGYGTVTGLCGANCRHNFGPYFEGMENPFEQYDAEENRKAYETQQKQRTMERRIRDTKRQTMNWKEAMDKETDPVKKAMFEEEYQRKAALLQKQNAAYRQFCKDNDLKLQADRISIARWDRQQAAMARSAASRHDEATVERSIASGSKSSGKRKTGNGKQILPSENTEYVAAKWNDSIGTSSWDTETRQELFAVERSTIRLTKEKAHIFGSDGNQLVVKSGGAHHVTFLDKEIKEMRGGVLTHNHSDGTCFSPQDINMLRRGKLVELRAVTPDGVYRVQAPEHWHTEISTLEKIEKMYYHIDSEVAPDFYRRAFSGEFSMWDAEKLAQEAVIKELCKKYDIPFMFDRWEDLE